MEPMAKDQLLRLAVGPGLTHGERSGNTSRAMSRIWVGLLALAFTGCLKLATCYELLTCSCLEPDSGTFEIDDSGVSALTLSSTGSPLTGYKWAQSFVRQG